MPQSIANLQENLRYLSLARNLPQLFVSVDGFYNEETQQAVRNFQQMMKIPVTGIADRATRTAIAEMAAEEARLRQPVMLRAIPDDRGYETLPGERSDTVLLLQVILGALREKYSWEPVPLSGVYGTQTADAVREFQRIAGLQESGRADRTTWRRLSEEYGRI